MVSTPSGRMRKNGPPSTIGGLPLCREKSYEIDQSMKESIPGKRTNSNFFILSAQFRKKGMKRRQTSDDHKKDHHVSNSGSGNPGGKKGKVTGELRGVP